MGGGEGGVFFLSFFSFLRILSSVSSVVLEVRGYLKGTGVSGPRHTSSGQPTTCVFSEHSIDFFTLESFGISKFHKNHIDRLETESHSVSEVITSVFCLGRRQGVSVCYRGRRVRQTICLGVSLSVFICVSIPYVFTFPGSILTEYYM